MLLSILKLGSTGRSSSEEIRGLFRGWLIARLFNVCLSHRSRHAGSELTCFRRCASVLKTPLHGGKQVKLLEVEFMIDKREEAGVIDAEISQKLKYWLGARQWWAMGNGGQWARVGSARVHLERTGQKQAGKIEGDIL
jgi:hypothetical protein